jgi:hypothetical protein
MNERKLARIAQRMTTTDFAVDLHIARLKMNHADATGARYDEADLARDIGVPVSIALISGASKYDIPWGNIMAASVLVTIPLLGLVLAFQKKIVSGLTAGAVKG